MMWLMLFMSMCKHVFSNNSFLVYGMFMANAFKSFGEKHHLDDLSLTVAGSLGSIMNGFSRIYFPII